MAHHFQDILFTVFSFLDYSHNANLCLVCLEWNQIASSNQLWEFYFRHQLSNNTKAKTNISSIDISENNELFWKHKIRDEFSKYNCRISNSITTRLPRKNYFELDSTLGFLHESLPREEPFIDQLIKMILSRITIDEVWSTPSLKIPFSAFKSFSRDSTLDETFSDGGDYFKLRITIEGVDESIIVRCFVYSQYFALFGYNYSNNSFLYFATESDDKLNEQFMQEDNIDIEKLRKFNRSFIFKFNGRLKPANVYGSEYLVDKILSIIVPTNKEFDLTPKQFIPVWCFLIGLLINKMDDGSDYNLSKEYYKYYPNLCSNRLAINLLRKILLQNPVLSNLGNTKISIDKIMTTSANSCNVILKSIISNESIPLPTFPLEEEMDICFMINAVMNQLTRHKKIFFAKYASHPPDGIKDRVTGIIDLALLDANLKYATNVYQFLTNVGEYMDVFMNYKYNPNRSTQKGQGNCLEALKQDTMAIQFVDKSLLNDKDVVMEAIKNPKTMDEVFNYVDVSWFNDRDVAMELAKQGHVVQGYKNDKEIILVAVKQDERALRYADESLSVQKDFVLEVLKQNGLALEYVDEELLEDNELSLQAIKQNGRALEYADESLREDREIVIEAVKQNGKAFAYADKSLKEDREIALLAVKQNGRALGYMSKLLRDDREIVLEAVRQKGTALLYVSRVYGCNLLNEDREICLEAVRQNGSALEYSLNDREIVLEAVKQNGLALEFVHYSTDNYREIVDEAIKQNGLCLRYVMKSLRGNREIVLEAVKQNGLALEFADKSLQCDREIVLEAIKQNGLALEFADELMKKDKEIVVEAFKQNGGAFQFADESLVENGENGDIFLETLA